MTRMSELAEKLAPGIEGVVPPKVPVSADFIPKPPPPTIAQALKESGGSLVLAASRLGVSVSKLDNAIQMSRPGKWPAFVRALQRVKLTEEYRKMSLAQIAEDIERRVMLYRSEALDAIRDLATMPLSDNSAQNQVKLAAAIRLYGETREKVANDAISEVLRSINEDFRESAPRLRTIRREIQEMTFEGGEKLAIEGTVTAAD